MRCRRRVLSFAWAATILWAPLLAQDPVKPVTAGDVKRIKIALDGVARKEREAALTDAAARISNRPAENGKVALELAQIFFAAGLNEAACPFGIQYLESQKKRTGGAAKILQQGLERATNAPTFLAFAKQGRRVYPRGVIRSSYGMLEQLSQATVFEVEVKTLAKMRDSASKLLVKGETRMRFLGWTGLLGKTAPALEMPHVLGGKLTPKDLAGKVVLLDFFAFWCESCKAAFPHLQELHNRHHENGLRVVSVTWFQGAFFDRKTGVSDDPRRKGKKLTKAAELGYLERFRKAWELPWPMVVEGEAYARVRGLSDVIKRKNCENYFMRPIPQLVLIDRVGKVRLIAVTNRNRKLINVAIETLLDESVPEKK